MKTYLAAVALAAASQTASSTTFPKLTTIYVGTGVLDDGGADNTGTASSFFCSNVSGLTAEIRVLILNSNATVVGDDTNTIGHGVSQRRISI